MRTETSLRKQKDALASLKDIYSRARTFKFTHAKLLEERMNLIRTLVKCPDWVVSYLDGAEAILSDNLYMYDLEYCSFAPDGTLVSHHRKSPRYYETLGYSPESICNKNIKGGHYWEDTDKPFFVSHNELSKVVIPQSAIDAAAEAEEKIPIDELEAYAKEHS